MQPTKTSTHIITFILAAVLLLIGVVGIKYIAHPLLQKSGNLSAPLIPTIPEGAVVAHRVVLTGTQVCLPHRDTTGPQTMECAFGIKTTDGKYYAVDYNLMSQTPPIIPAGQTFTASGILTPVEMLSTNQWQKYDMVGILSVTDNLIINN